MAQIKSGAEVSCSDNKRCAQKRLGRARHATNAAVSTPRRKLASDNPPTSCLSLKRANNSLCALGSFSQIKRFAFNKPLLVRYDVSEIKAITWRGRTLACIADAIWMRRRQQGRIS
ncbi:50S ribosomal subunit protein L4 [Candidatus Hodgkinia cicadicola]|nr:50S ribosomal subunit protein L4 [Candidatus Hodgkinia cicadicola]